MCGKRKLWKKFFELYREQPCLDHTKLKVFYSRDMKKVAMEHIAKELGMYNKLE